jgi:arylsulfatase
MGYRRKTTPTIDRMARKGLYFENAIAAGIGTPTSMMGAFTGEFAPLIDEMSPEIWRIEFAKRKTLGQVLSGFGYSTGAFVPNVFASRYFGFNKGFQFFHDFLKDKGKIYEKIFKLVLRNSKIAFAIRSSVSYLLRREAFTPWEKYYDKIIRWIEKVKEPFFLWVLLMDTHYPYLAPRKFRKWGSFWDMYYYNWKLQHVNFEDRLCEKEKQRLINVYDDSLRYTDEFIRRFLKDLESYDPVYIIHSDHGEGFGEHGYYMHGFVRNKAVCLYEELIHIPLVIYNADIGGKISTPVSLSGLSPTILEIIGKTSEFPSESFLSNNSAWVIVRTIESGRAKIAVRMKNWKYILGQKDVDELYNLRKDPKERENLIHEHPRLADEMRKIAKSHIKREIGASKMGGKS